MQRGSFTGISKIILSANKKLQLIFEGLQRNVSRFFSDFQELTLSNRDSIALFYFL